MLYGRMYIMEKMTYVGVLWTHEEEMEDILLQVATVASAGIYDIQIV